MYLLKQQMNLLTETIELNVYFERDVLTGVD